MSNVLPPDAKKRLWGAYRARFVLMGSLLMTLAALLGCMALLPTYLALKADDTTDASAVLSGEERAKDQMAMSEARGLLSILAPLAVVPNSPMSVIGRALTLRPKGVLVDHIEYTRGEVSTLVLAGASDARDGVSVFRTALMSEPLFKNVSVPVGDILGTGTGRFSMTINGTF